MKKVNIQPKLVQEIPKEQLETPSSKAIEIAARILANRAKREIDVAKLQLPKTEL